AQLRADVVARMAGVSDGQLWLEKLRLDIRPPGRKASGAVSDDVAALLAAAVHDPAFHESFLESRRGLSGRASIALAYEPVFKGLRGRQVEGILQEAAAAVLDRLGREG